MEQFQPGAFIVHRFVHNREFRAPVVYVTIGRVLGSIGFGGSAHPRHFVVFEPVSKFVYVDGYPDKGRHVGVFAETEDAAWQEDIAPLFDMVM